MSTERARDERTPRWHLGCNACGAGAWVGPRAGGVDAWCEACQRPVALAAGVAEVCPSCGAALATEVLRSEELYGELQHLSAVLHAWRGAPGPLASLLPDRPRLLTDLTPPAPGPGDEPAVAAALRSLAAGAFAAARARLEPILAKAPEASRLWRALAVAYERLGEPGFAEWAWTRLLECDDVPVARLARGVLRARRGEFRAAAADLGRAGDSFEARWNRAALIVLEAVAGSPGLPAPETLARARAEAGEPSPYWSNPTVGRLLWTLLVERAGGAATGSAARGEAACPDQRVLRAAEHELEFDTFWDRALVAHGYVACGMRADAARTASTLARGRVERLAMEPYLAGAAARSIAQAIGGAAAAIHAGDPAAALAALEPLTAREDIARYRMPCAHCGRGTIGVDQVEDEAEP